MGQLKRYLIICLICCLFSLDHNTLARHDSNGISNDILITGESNESRSDSNKRSPELFDSSTSSPSSSPLSSSSSSPGSDATTVSLSSSSSSPASKIIKDGSVGGSDNIIKTLCSENPLQACQNLSIDCLDCAYDYSCDFGEVRPVTCSIKKDVECQGPRTFQHNYTCAYCYQFPESNYYCTPSLACRVNSKYLTDCTMKSHVLCLGNRNFQRYKTCNFVSGYKWSTALLLSITLGGFGIDRFYLGYWQEGIGKLFSFGGFGVWTLVDIILIATGYLKPADGSRYINDFAYS